MWRSCVCDGCPSFPGTAWPPLWPAPTPTPTHPPVRLPCVQRDRDMLFTAVAYTKNQTGQLVDLIGGVHGTLKTFIAADQVSA